MTAELYNLKTGKVGTLTVPESVFGVPWKPAAIEQVLLAQLANRRRPWAHTKGRGEVRGGGRKPWRQKGTGRARHGSIRSPLWRGGGKAHGPQKERDYSQKVNKKMKRLALLSALSRKFKDGEVKIFDSLALETPKTKALAHTAASFLKLEKGKKKLDILFIPEEGNVNLTRASSNLPKTKALLPHALNLYDILNYKNVFIDQKAIPVLRKGEPTP